MTLNEFTQNKIETKHPFKVYLNDDNILGNIE